MTETADNDNVDHHSSRTLPANFTFLLDFFFRNCFICIFQWQILFARARERRCSFPSCKKNRKQITRRMSKCEKCSTHRQTETERYTAASVGAVCDTQPAISTISATDIDGRRSETLIFFSWRIVPSLRCQCLLDGCLLAPFFLGRFPMRKYFPSRPVRLASSLTCVASAQTNWKPLGKCPIWYAASRATVSRFVFAL